MNDLLEMARPWMLGILVGGSAVALLIAAARVRAIRVGRNRIDFFRPWSGSPARAIRRR